MINQPMGHPQKSPRVVPLSSAMGFAAGAMPGYHIPPLIVNRTSKFILVALVMLGHYTLTTKGAMLPSMTP
jgi:hypothetical protein